MEQANRSSPQGSGLCGAAQHPRSRRDRGGHLRATTSAALAVALAAATVGFTAAHESADDAARSPGPSGGYATAAPEASLVLPVAIAGPTESTTALLVVKITTDPAVPADTLQGLRGYVGHLLEVIVESAPGGAASYPERIAMVRRAIEEAVPVSIAPLLPRNVRATVGTSIALAEGWRASAGRPAGTGGDPSVQGSTPARPPAPPEGFHVQAGAFNHLEYARDLLRQLRARGYRARLVEATEGPPHRVWVGPVPDRASAVHLAARLRADGFEAILLAP